MVNPYVDVLRRPGAVAMSSAAFVARMPIAMIGLGIVLLVSLQTGKYGLAGALSASEALANAAFGPMLARLVDRLGQHRVLPWVTTGHVLALAVFVVLVVEQAPVPLLFLTVIVQGALMPNIGAMIRARWAHLLAGDPPRLRTAFAYESVIDELIFVVGPLLATILAVYVVGWGALAACILLISVGTALLSAQRGTEPPPSGARAHGGRSALRYPGVAAVTVVFVMFGGLFGSFEVVTVAFAQHHGIEGAAGWLLALYSVGSGIAGLTLGALRLQTALNRQLLLTSAVLALVMLPFPFITTVWLLGVVSLLSGLACSPVLISAFALIERLVPNARLTEGLVWTNAGLGLGLALAAALAGHVIDTRGPNTAYFISTACAVGAFLAVALASRSLDRAWRAAVAVPQQPADRSPGGQERMSR
ncbi:MAG: MFS transporter [Candidatus Nanopelagicales bacterium]